MKLDNNTLAVTGLAVAMIMSLIWGTENITIAIASGLVGFITGENMR